MDARLQRRVQRYGWDKAAEYYEGFWADQLEPAQRCLLDMAALRSGMSVLDIACGTGLVTFPAADAVGPEGEIVATDLSAVMVEAVGREAEQRGLAQVRWQRAGAEELPFEDERFDVALCALGLMYVPDPVVALRETARVLRPGGRAVAAVWGRREQCGWADIFPIVDARVASEVCPMFFRLGTGDAMRLAFGMAGFDGLRAERISSVLEYHNEEEALGAAFLGGPVAMAYSRFDETVREEAQADYLRSIADFRRGEGYEIPGEFVVVSGVRSSGVGPALVLEGAE